MDLSLGHFHNYSFNSFAILEAIFLNPIDVPGKKEELIIKTNFLTKPT